MASSVPVDFWSTDYKSTSSEELNDGLANGFAKQWGELHCQPADISRCVHQRTEIHQGMIANVQTPES
jgi:hypothetical protein